MKYKKTFTLFEILIVVALLGLISSLTVPFGRALLQEYKKNFEVESLQLFVQEAELEATLKGKIVVFRLNQNNKKLSLKVFFEKEAIAIKQLDFYFIRLLSEQEVSFFFHPVYQMEKIESLEFTDLKGKKIAIKF